MTDTNGSEIVAVQSGLVESTDDIIASAERRIAHLDKIITLSLKMTNQNDWIDQQGKPYLTGSGAEKVGRLFGVCWKILKKEKTISEDEKGNFYIYEYTGEFTLGKDRIETVGTCSQKDQFFAKKGGELKPISEIDETNIMKAAYTNCIVNGITRILGIRNLTWEQVEKAGNIKRGSTAKVNYAEGGAGGGKISEAQRKRLFAICKQNGKQETEIKEFLKKQYKIESTNDIKTKDYDAICKWAETTNDGIEME